MVLLIVALSVACAVHAADLWPVQSAAQRKDVAELKHALRDWVASRLDEARPKS